MGNQKILAELKRIIGAGFWGTFLTVIFEIPIFYCSLKFNFMPIKISFRSGFLLGSLFLIFYLYLTWWSFKFLPPEKRGKVLIKEGPYKYVRHPSYFAKIFFLLPSLSLFLRIWLPIFSLPIVILIWYPFLNKEEKELAKEFGNEFKKYSQSTRKLFPWPKI